MIRNTELLSPAGSWDALVAAVQNGADAVYLGGTRFNARRLADNFNDEQIREAVAYAHLYGVRVYIVINTLIKEKEFEELNDFLSLLKGYQIDGIIVQDLGVASLIAEEHPDIPIHASTQMTIHQLEGVKVLEGMGFDRVVLARELSLYEIKHITEQSSLEIETFIHGALCVCYSGQCLMSSLLGGRSGNRGMCAQPCRLPYALKATENGGFGEPIYHLSTKDLSVIDILPQLLEAGIASLKIEGRMKRAEYVAVVTRVYREAINKMNDNAYSIDDQHHKALMQIFNRGGFTNGYYLSMESKERMAFEKPNHWGVYLGKTVKSKNTSVYIQLEDDLKTGDHIAFWTNEDDNSGQMIGCMRINGSKIDKATAGQTVEIDSKCSIATGTPVYRTSQAEQLSAAGETYAHPYAKKIPIKAIAVFRLGEFPTLRLEDNNGVLGEAVVQQSIEPGLRKILDKEQITIQLNKLGDTPFVISSMDLFLDQGAFLPLSAINLLRRTAVEQLSRNRIKYYDQRAIAQSSNKQRNMLDQYSIWIRSEDSPQLCGYINHLSYSPQALKDFDIVAYCPDEWPMDMEQLSRQVKALRSEGLTIRLVIPRITRAQDIEMIRKTPDVLWQMFDGYQAGNLGVIRLLEEKKVQTIYGDYSLNVYNARTIHVLRSLGLSSIVLSPELTIGEIYDIIKRSVLPCEITVFGRLPLMVMEYCPIHCGKEECNNCDLPQGAVFKDRRDYSFPMVKRRIARSYTEMLNSQPLFIGDDAGKIIKIPAAVWGFRLEGYSAEDIKDIAGLYRYALNHPTKALPPQYKQAADRLKQDGFTRGHFFRGVD